MIRVDTQGRNGVPAQDLFTHIPDFEFKELLGGGGFGAVRRAVDKLGRDVAIKVLTLEVDGEERAASNRQFLKEATTLAKLNHPNIVTLYSFDIDSIGRPYLVMEYIPGTPLNKLIKTGQLHLAEKLFIVLQTAKALQAAHSARPTPVIHRDVKPHNIIVKSDCSVKLIDFGIAQAKGTKSLTSKDVAGSFPYMSPEHWLPPMSPWGDVFSLGVVLFELLTGAVPFATEADTIPSAYGKIMSLDAAPPIFHYGNFPAGLAEIVARVLGKQRSASYEDAHQFALELSRVFHKLKHSFFASQLTTAREAQGMGNYERALEILAEIQAMDPGNESAGEVQAEINEALAQRERRVRVEMVRTRIEEALLNRNFAAADEMLRQALRVDPASPALSSLGFRLQQAQDLYRRIEELVVKADEQQRLGRLQTAARLLDEALGLDRANTVALKRRANLERIMAQEYELCQRARELLDQGQFKEAFDSIRQAEALAPDSERVKALKELAVSLHHEQAVRAEVDRLHAAAQARLQAGDLAGARHELEAALATFPDQKKLHDLRGLLETTEENAKRRIAAAQACETAERELAAGSAVAAMMVIQKALERFPAEPRLRQLAEKARKQVAVEEQAGRRAQSLANARRSLAASDAATAVVTLEMALAEFPGDVELQSLLDEARERTARVETAGSLREGPSDPAEPSPLAQDSLVPRILANMPVASEAAENSVALQPDGQVASPADHPATAISPEPIEQGITGPRETPGKPGRYRVLLLVAAVLAVVVVVAFILRSSHGKELQPAPAASGSPAFLQPPVSKSQGGDAIIGGAGGSPASLQPEPTGGLPPDGSSPAPVKTPTPVPAGKPATDSPTAQIQVARSRAAAKEDAARRVKAAIAEGDLYLRNGEYQQAIDTYRQGLQADRSNASLQNKIRSAQLAWDTERGVVK